VSATGKRAVVTGAASGIGEAVVHRLLREGIDVLAVDVDAERLASVAAAGAQALVADLGTEVGCTRVVEAGAGADYLVNSAGIIRLRPILEVDRADWREIFRVNAEAIFFLCQQLGPTLREGGAIVNLSSVSAKLTSTLETAVYAASKTTILSITRSFAYAFAARNIRVNAICPGITDTPMQDKVLDDIAALRGVSAQELSDKRTATVPLARGAAPSEQAAAVWFLLSDESSYMTGESMNVSGGLAMW
jgi:NAD(P)-dependent dehydrogenase (short-subunit alcohol dehydrogenase family)